MDGVTVRLAGAFGVSQNGASKDRTRPFLYLPPVRHFEQQIHVAHRVNRYGAGRRMDRASTDPDELAAAAAEELDRTVDYRPVAAHGACRAAGPLGELLQGLFDLGRAAAGDAAGWAGEHRDALRAAVTEHGPSWSAGSG